MNITSLKESPRYIQETLSLIQESFGYSKENHFDIDFYPLFNKDNFRNCFILIEDGKVIAHIGRLEKNILVNKKSFSFSMFGGIAVAEAARGKGNFKEFFEEILLLEKNTCFSLLWSEKLDLYERFEFFPCVNLKSYSSIKTKTKFTVTMKNFKTLSDEVLIKVKDLYQSSSEIRINRTEQDWVKLAKITSANIGLIYRGSELINYFIKDKGQDLSGIVHEYGFIDNEQLEVFLNHGDVWTTYSSKDFEFQELFGSILKINDKNLFKNFILEFSEIRISKIRHNFVDFIFKEVEYQLPQKDFLQGVFGPGRFEELNEFSELYICGLDSI